MPYVQSFATSLVLMMFVLSGIAKADRRSSSLERTVAEFSLSDCEGRPFSLGDFKEHKLVAVVFIGVDCPLAKLYATRLCQLKDKYSDNVAFLAIDSNHRDSVERIAKWAELHNMTIPVLCDPRQEVADCFGATRNPEVFLLDQQRSVRYHGRIDDQYTTAAKTIRPRRNDLMAAIDELLADRPVTVSETQMTGCFIDRSDKATTGRQPVTYYADVLPIMRRRCVACHREGQSAPFPLITFEQAASWLETIREVVEQRRMPPWYANPRYGHFANDARLSFAERTTLLNWVETGGAEGNPSDAPKNLIPVPSDEWNISGPDVIISIPEPFTVPADGIIDYQYYTVDPGFKEDTWVRAAEMRPTNPAVVHHCRVLIRRPRNGAARYPGELGAATLLNSASGRPPLILPAGMAKLVPAGWHFEFEIHYQSIGSVQTDQLRIGLTLADPNSVNKEVASRLHVPEHLEIPPGDADYRVTATETMSQSVLLLSMAPHMHLRGKSFRYEAYYPGGAHEILLDIPRWNFDWQDRYILEKPKLLPKGTRLVSSASYDNSSANPYNPDPTVTVYEGLETTDEMFNAWYDIVLADQDRTDRRAWSVMTDHPVTMLCLASLGLLVLWRLQRVIGG